jgi:hypothetical protein
MVGLPRASCFHRGKHDIDAVLSAASAFSVEGFRLRNAYIGVSFSLWTSQNRQPAISADQN